MNRRSGFSRLARSAFVALSSVLLLLALPLDVLLRLSSWVLSMPNSDIARDVALMTLLLAALSVALAVAISLVVSASAEAIRRSYPKRADAVYEVAEAACALGAVGLMAMVLLYAFRIWIFLATGGSLAMGLPAFSKIEGVAIVAVGLVPVLWLVWRFGLVRAGSLAQQRLARGAKPVAAMVMLGAIALLSHELLFRVADEDPKGASLTAPDAPNVFLISMDALAAEDMSLYGYRLPTTPHLDGFSADSYVFDHFFSSSNWTPPSVASMLSGLHPHSHGVNHLYGYFLAPDRHKNLASVLKRHGYETAAIVSNVMASPAHMHAGDGFSALLLPSSQSAEGHGVLRRTLSKLRAWYSYRYPRNHKWLSQWLQPLLSLGRSSQSDEDAQWTPLPPFAPTSAAMKGFRQPFFVWTHVYPPHAPYMPGSDYKYRFGKFPEFSTLKDFENFGLPDTYSPGQQPLVDKARLRYDEYVLDIDSHIGAFLSELKAAGYFENSIIIVTSDHGESFSRGKVTHGGPFLHRSLIQIPLLIHLPGQRTGKRIAHFGSHVDLLPTILDLLGLPVPQWAEGESLKASMLQNAPTLKPKLSMNLERDSRFAVPALGTVALMHDGWKLIRNFESGAEQLYRLTDDPSEQVNLSSSHSDQAGRLRELMHGSIKR